MLSIRRRALPVLVVIVALFSLVVSGCSKPAATNPAPTAADKNVVLKVGATPVPHAEILDVVKPLLAKQGIDLQIKVFNDYVQPNLAVDKGELDANFFQHAPYLNEFNKDHNLKLVSIAKVHVEPMGFYSKKATSKDQIPSGTTVAIPNDATNGGRALALLAKAGLIQLKDGVGVMGTVQDVTGNLKQLKITPMEAAQLPRVLDDPKVGGAVINGNYALDTGLNPIKDSLVLEDKDSPYANILVVKDTRQNEDALKKLAAALNSPEVKQFIQDKYKGGVIPAF